MLWQRMCCVLARMVVARSKPRIGRKPRLRLQAATVPQMVNETVSHCLRCSRHRALLHPCSATDASVDRHRASYLCFLYRGSSVQWMVWLWLSWAVVACHAR